MATTGKEECSISGAQAARVCSALANAARWRLLALLFERPRRSWHEEVRGLAAEVDEPKLKAAAGSAAKAEEGSYLAVFGPSGQVSPREVAYRPMGDPGKILAELGGLYKAFAYHPQAEDPADHVAVEAGFIGYLALKEAYALARNNGDEARTTRRAMQSFIQEHLTGFAEDLARQLDTFSVPHLTEAASVLAELVCFAGTRSVEQPQKE